MRNVGTINSSRTKCLLLVCYRSIFVPLLFATNWINCKCCIVSQTYSPGTWFSVQSGRKVCMTSGSTARVYCMTYCPLNQVKRKFVLYFFVTHAALKKWTDKQFSQSSCEQFLMLSHRFSPPPLVSRYYQAHSHSQILWAVHHPVHSVACWQFAPKLW